MMMGMIAHTIAFIVNDSLPFLPFNPILMADSDNLNHVILWKGSNAFKRTQWVLDFLH